MFCDEWYTPPEIIHALGSFDLDPASCKEAYKINHSAKKIYTIEDDGLSRDWHGRVWLNPPYSNPAVKNFLSKMADHNCGTALMFSKIEAKWFHDVVLKRATLIKCLYDRVKFYKADGTLGNQPRNGSMLIAYGKADAQALMENKLKGTLLFLKNDIINY